MFWLQYKGGCRTKMSSWMPFQTWCERNSAPGREGSSHSPNVMKYYSASSVPDPWHFKTDPDPWIRTLDYRYGSGSCSSRQWHSRCQQNVSFIKFVFCLFLTVGTFTSAFKDKTSLGNHNTVESRFFNFFLLVDERIQILEAQKHTSASYIMKAL